MTVKGALRLGACCCATLGISTACVAHDQNSNALVSGVSVMLGPTSADATGADFVDADGRRWIAIGPAVFRTLDVATTEVHDASTRLAPGTPIEALSVSELADLLRPRRLVGGYEYRLAEPDLKLAERILAMPHPPPTDGHRPSTPTALDLVVDTGVLPQFVIPPTEDRALRCALLLPERVDHLDGDHVRRQHVRANSSLRNVPRGQRYAARRVE